MDYEMVDDVLENIYFKSLYFVLLKVGFFSTADRFFYAPPARPARRGPPPTRAKEAVGAVITRTPGRSC